MSDVARVHHNGGIVQLMISDIDELVVEHADGTIELLSENVDDELASAIDANINAHRNLVQHQSSQPLPRIGLDAWRMRLDEAAADPHAYVSRERERRREAYQARAEGRRASFAFVSVDDLPPAVQADELQRWNPEYTKIDWKRIQAAAKQYLDRGGDPLDLGMLDQSQAMRELTDDERPWLRSLFSDTICYPVDDPTLFSNGRHRTLAMRQQGVSSVLVELQNTPESEQAYIASLHAAAGEPQAPQLERIDQLPSPALDLSKPTLTR